jgi:hypothetical protein
MERFGLDCGTEPGRDVLGGGVGLLGSQAALLDRKRRSVAGGIDIVDAPHAGVLVDRDEAVLVPRQSR